MNNVQRFWCHDADNIMCVREFDYDTAVIALGHSDSANQRLAKQVAGLRQHKTDYMEAAEETRKALQAKIETMQQRLNAADQRADDLETEIQQLKAGYIWEIERAALLLDELQGSERESGSQQPAFQEDDIPVFSPGNGNKARRRAAALGASAFSDANEPPCTACSAPGCNGECSGDGAMGD